MSKSHGKQHRKAPPGAGLSSLRPRLDELLRGERLAQPDQPGVYEELDAVTRGIKPAAFLPALVAACQAAPAPVQALLDDVVPDWLHERGHLAALRDLAARESLGADQRQRALAWLAATGDEADLAAIEAWDPFFDAYLASNEAQAALMIFWHTSRRKHRAQGLNLLLDFQPPWEGAVKDAFQFAQRMPQAAIEEYVGRWRKRGMELEQLTAVEAKRRALEALESNRREHIRLPEDLIDAREPFLRYVLALPDGPDTPRFDAEDFDFLARNGRQPEALKRDEQRFGYRARMPDGREIRILRGPDDDEW